MTDIEKTFAQFLTPEQVNRSKHLIGDINPDPHYRLQVSPGQFTCAVPGCTEHLYPSSSVLLEASFVGGEEPGTGQVRDAPPSVMRNGREYALGYYQEADGHPEPVYFPAEEMP